MDLSNPMLSKEDKEWLDEVVSSKDLSYYPDQSYPCIMKTK